MTQPKFASNAQLDDWRGAITIFPSANNTTPASEQDGLTWRQLCSAVASESAPALLTDKHRGPYFVPCLLADAPLVGKTLERAKQQGLPLIGKQRSAAHMTAASWVIFDLDGLDRNNWNAIKGSLYSCGCSWLVYTTHSHGRADKPRRRLRLILPTDRALNSTDYKRVWAVLNSQLLGGRADPSGGKLCQQQGTWMAHPERAHLAWKKSHDAGLLAVAALLALAPSTTEIPHVATANKSGAVTTMEARRVRSALAWIDPNRMETWTRAGMCVKALTPILGTAAAETLWIEFTESAIPEAKGQNTRRQYDPALMFHNFAPTMTLDVAAAALFKAARDGATAAVESDRGRAAWSIRGRQAAIYLAQHHARHWAALKHEVAA